MLDPHTKEQIENVAKRQIKDVKDHICYGVETESQLMYARQTQRLRNSCFRILKTCTRRITMVQLIKPKLTDFNKKENKEEVKSQIPTDPEGIKKYLEIIPNPVGYRMLVRPWSRPSKNKRRCYSSR